MKAAVLQKFGDTPRYQDFPDPVPSQNEVLIQVKAVTLENIDKMMTEGTHFASKQFLTQLPAIVGFDGIGELPDGRLVGFGGTKAPYGAMAEKTVVPSMYTVPVPDDVDAVIAAALPASALTSLFPLKWGAKLQQGETVLINGATGVSGKLAVQIAKLLGAGRIVGTGRNPESLERVIELGADAVIDLTQSEQQVMEAFKKEADIGIDIVLDFLWGSPTELLIKALTPQELGFTGHRTRLIQIGEKAGASISLPADALRTSGLEITGAAAGLTAEAMNEGTNLVWEWLKGNKLTMDIEEVPLQDIETIWKRNDFQGKRIVIIP
ncbi:quinone oxidoreductase family protein [Neobacillus jeddahensis]|uniref:quinone oxidoreductase family protein n=1 Tax=Neobacillus jeddahensis TaxID=1461580 RepID=UPI00058D55A7|nr:zinc-binding alcohol dehydrogenase family protein [Neobacillus jeddahensis]